jgi:hypothetical protein
MTEDQSRPEWASLTMKNGLQCRIRGGHALLQEALNFLRQADEDGNVPAGALEKHPNLKLLLAASAIEEELPRQARALLERTITKNGRSIKECLRNQQGDY